jgi:hypothetical protein
MFRWPQLVRKWWLQRKLDRANVSAVPPSPSSPTTATPPPSPPLIVPASPLTPTRPSTAAASTATSASPTQHPPQRSASVAGAGGWLRRLHTRASESPLARRFRERADSLTGYEHTATAPSQASPALQPRSPASSVVITSFSSRVQHHAARLRTHANSKFHSTASVAAALAASRWANMARRMDALAAAARAGARSAELRTSAAAAAGVSGTRHPMLASAMRHAVASTPRSRGADAGRTARAAFRWFRR